MAIRRQQYEDVNGFHNDFWGWGGEDDDLSNRLSSKGYQIVHDLTSSGRFHSLEHPSVKANPNRYGIYHLSDHISMKFSSPPERS